MVQIYRSLNELPEVRGQKIALYSGKFNPPHRGHVDIAKLFLSDVDEVWFRPHFWGNDAGIHINHRVKMLDLCLENDDSYRVVVDPRDFGGVLGFYEEVRKRIPRSQLYILSGSDNITLGYVENVLCAAPHLIALMNSAPYFDFSCQHAIVRRQHTTGLQSKGIRKKIRNGDDVSEMLHPDVYGYILANRLYAS